VSSLSTDAMWPDVLHHGVSFRRARKRPLLARRTSWSATHVLLSATTPSPRLRASVAEADRFCRRAPSRGAHFPAAGGFIGVTAASYDEILLTTALMTAASVGVHPRYRVARYRSGASRRSSSSLPLALAEPVGNAYMAAARHRPR